MHSRMWHRVFDAHPVRQVPVVAVLHGAVVGGGLELAAACHLRVAERSAYYALPEGSRGIFLGGGGSVRLPRLIGVSRVMELMLTGRTYGAEEGQTYGLSHMVVDDGKGLAKGIELAERVAQNAPLSNFAIMHALPRIAESDPAQRAVRRIADGVGRVEQRRGQDAAEGFSGEARQEGASRMSVEAMRDTEAADGAAAPGQARAGRRRARPQARRHDLSSLAASARRLSRQADGAAGALGQGGAGPRVPGAARAGRLMAHAHLRADAGAGARHRAGAAAAQALRRAADRDPVRQRHRARAARPRRHDDRRALRADLGALLADVERLRQAQVDHRDADAGPGVCRRRQGVRPRHRGGGAARRRDRRHRRSAGERPATLFADLLAAKPTDAVDAAHAKVGPDTIAQNPVHLGLDRLSQGRHQHPAHAVLEPGDDPREPCSSSPTSRRCWSTGRRGTTPSAATTISAWCCTTAARSTSTRASRCPAPSKPPCATCARSRRPSISTCPRASRCCCRICASDAALRQNFFSRLKVLFYAGAGLARHVWDELQQMARRHHGRAHHLPVQPRLDRDRAARRSPAPGNPSSPATSACRCAAWS